MNENYKEIQDPGLIWFVLKASCAFLFVIFLLTLIIRCSFPPREVVCVEGWKYYKDSDGRLEAYRELQGKMFRHAKCN